MFSMEIQNYNGKNEIDFLGTRIITVQYLGELEKYHEIHVKNYKNVSEIYESPISFSFRVYDSQTRITKFFFQCLKD